MKSAAIAIFLALIPSVALAQEAQYGYPVSWEQPEDMTCFMQTSEGNVLDLGQLCGNRVVAAQRRQRVTSELANRVQVGMTLEQVNQIMGFGGRRVTDETATTDAFGNSSSVVYSWRNSNTSYFLAAFVDGKVVTTFKRNVF